MNPSVESLAARVRAMRMAALVSWFLLFGLLTAMSFTVTPPGSNPVTIWLLQTTPLLCFLPGLIQGTPRTHVWLCFLAMIYFTQGVLTTIRPAYLWWGIAETVLAVGLFIDALLYARWATDLEKARSGLSQK